MIIETRLEEEEAPKKLKRRRKPAATAQNAADGAALTADGGTAPVVAKPKRTKKPKPAEGIVPKPEKKTKAAEEAETKPAKEAKATEEVEAKPAKKTKATKKAEPVVEPEPVAEEKPAKKPRTRKKIAVEAAAVAEATATPEPVVVEEQVEEPAAKKTTKKTAAAKGTTKKTTKKAADEEPAAEEAKEAAVVEEPAAKDATEATVAEEPKAEEKPKKRSRRLKSITDEIEIIPEPLPAKPAKKKPRIKKAKAEPVAEAVPAKEEAAAESAQAAAASPFAKYDALIEEAPAVKVSPFAKYEEMIKNEDTSNRPKPVYVKRIPDTETRGKKKQQQALEEEMEFLLDDEYVAISKMTKGNIWSYDVKEIYDMLIEGRRAEHWAENRVHYMNIIRPVFDIVFFMKTDEETIKKLETEGYMLFPYPPVNGIINIKSNDPDAIAIRKHKIKKITDLTMENIFHVEPREVLRLIEENMGTGWQGLPLPIQDIIQTAFYVDCSVLPATAMHRVGGIIDRRKEDGYEVLEIARGTWIEGVFIKHKPKMEKVRFESIAMRNERLNESDDEDDDDEDDDDSEDLTDEDLDRDDEDDDMMEDQTPQIEDFDSIAESDDDDE